MVLIFTFSSFFKINAYFVELIMNFTRFMLKNYFTLLWRNVYRQPFHAFLNITGLTVGIGAAILILLYIDFELNFDQFHQHSDRIYRVETKAIQTHEKRMDVNWQTTTANFAPLIKQDYPEVEQMVRFFTFYQNEPVHFQLQDQTFEEENVLVTDSTVFDIFSFDFIHGSPTKALNGPGKLVISESLAQRIFGSQNPIGQTLESQLVHTVTSNEENYQFTITGVFKDLPRNTHLFTHALISAASDPELSNYYFNRFNVYTYVLLHKTASPNTLASKLTAIYNNYLDPELEPVMKNAQHELIPLTKIHAAETGGMRYIIIFSAVGLLLLLISGISYVNLVTAQASRRALEVGIRKVLGSKRQQLIFQFLTESLIFTIMALSIALALVHMSVEPINQLFDLHLNQQQLWQPQMVLMLLFIILLLGVLGGSYPAFFLSSFQPIAVLKGKLAKGAGIRQGLVMVQFVVVLFVLTSTGMVYEQLQFLRKKDLGFSQVHLLQLNLMGQEEMDKVDVMKNALLSQPNIQAVTTCNFTPGIGGMIRRPVSADSQIDQEPQIAHVGYVDYDYFSTMDVKLLSGRNFSPDFPGDQQNSLIINEACIRNFGLEPPIIGQKIRWGSQGNPHFYQVIGVVKDFHQNSLHSPIESQLFSLRPTSPQLTIKVDQDLAKGIEQAKASWSTVFPDKPFNYQFLDELLATRYEADQRRGKIFFSFSILTIFIAFLGLFGLASYLARQRTKEIGIRKVFGAGFWNILVLMTRHFFLLVIVAALPAFAIAWYVVQKWLENFAFQVEMDYFLFGLVLVFTLLLTLLTTGFHAVRVSKINPAKTLKYE